MHASPHHVGSLYFYDLWSNQAPAVQSPSIKEPASAISKTDDDYFSLPTLSDSQAGVLSPGWPRLPAVLPASNMPPASSLTSSSSRGSWSSLFNTGSMRHFMSGVHESIATPLDTLSPRLAVVTPGGDGILRLPESPRRKEIRKDSSSSSTAPLSKSWSEPHVIPLTRPSLSQTSSHPSRRPTFSQAMNTKQAIQQKRLVIIDEDHDGMESESVSITLFLGVTHWMSIYSVQLKPFQLERFACHILSYADYLFRWQLMNKRLELLNAVKASAFMKTPPQSQLNFGFGMSYGSSIRKYSTLSKVFNRHAKDVAALRQQTWKLARTAGYDQENRHVRFVDCRSRVCRLYPAWLE